MKEKTKIMIYTLLLMIEKKLIYNIILNTVNYRK
jgi:hypothetical protein